MFRRLGAPTVLAVLAFSACSSDATHVALPRPDGEEFSQTVYPVLLRDCGTTACHGSSARFFRVLGPGRTRLAEKQAPLDPATSQEILESYRRARAMLQPDASGRVVLLRKPLALDAGGATHGGRDAYGRNVYASRRDPNYRVLEHWVQTAQAGDQE